eukprot:TRINITY_DN9796_c0_g1_i1.p1 TRINITY_DN9796_c0_g1~~TRINITY_DN9796_c0_g1_i1.p1  ORF type:complete len:105 (-),score=7.45 TRINITY_DN9796_c0_g1_i1:10-324(-)
MPRYARPFWKWHNIESGLPNNVNCWHLFINSGSPICGGSRARISEWRRNTRSNRRTVLTAMSSYSDLLDKVLVDTLACQDETTPEIGRAVQQECRDRSRMPSSA